MVVLAVRQARLILQMNLDHFKWKRVKSEPARCSSKYHLLVCRQPPFLVRRRVIDFRIQTAYDGSINMLT